MTTQTKWEKYNGTPDQITEIKSAKHGVIFKYQMMCQIVESKIINADQIDKFIFDSYPKEYWLIPADPLREMKIRQAQTGQPVWWRFSDTSFEPGVRCTTSPDWNIPNAEYSFAPFED